MSFDRVIQDSDDEDDPLLEERPPRAHTPPVVHQSDHRASYRDTSNDPLNEDSSRQIAVNFDQFLASQEGEQVGTASSQQQREERWIPTNAGGGSIGTMMTEIGLAQQRLFDDEEAQHGSARLGPSEAYGLNENNDQYIAPQQPEIHIQMTTPPGSYVSLPAEDGPSHDYLDNSDNYQHYAPTVNHNISLPSYDHTQSATSYNIFESSLRPSESTYSENNTTLKSHQTIPTEAIQRSPRRWNSTQGTISSPHDTEPNSSILAAKSSRSISDNNLSPNGPQQPPTSVDELSLPVQAEPPAVAKKRGRPKKQSLPDVDGDDELAQSVGPEAIEQPPVPEKRKPGRPSKNAKNTEANGVTANPENQPDDAQSIPNGFESKGSANETTTVVSDTFHAPNQESEPADAPKTKKEKAAKEPAKKKLKRGKTTSATLQKTYESDVEDDVIWVESRPSNTTAPQDANSAPFSINIETPTPQQPAEQIQPDTLPDQTDQAPKKRGRKRKKTSEQAPAADTTAQTPDSNPNDTNPPYQPEELPTETQQPSKESSPNPNPPLGHQSPTKTNASSPPLNPPTTPQKPDPATPNNASTSNKNSTKGPDKHSPISSTSKVPYRVGLSRRARIAPLLKIVKR
ncbi:uncharacterized protein LDX57_002744 [Aspergillus melleus]|uniref:uncharacterized protein n=1 Tax=Aspergillus melleus TaxID=138277 RepID=UPI001E8CA273|nr:uncharacterized protein LDX57_002744 [Aspergillus melleus]KAH8424998.1 hypothetical protein LDX57_002744 [Aspergillus melleus]